MLKLTIAVVLGFCGLLSTPPAGAAQRDDRVFAPERTVTCASTRGRYRECDTGFRGRVRLAHRLRASAPCIEGRTWGQRPGVVWVRRGCKAKFAAIGWPRRGEYTRGWGENDRDDGPPWVRDNNYSVTCSSSGSRTVCSWDSRYGTPRLIRQFSPTACIEGRDWGYDSRGGLWVDAGCRAQFGYR